MTAVELLKIIKSNCSAQNCDKNCPLHTEDKSCLFLVAPPAYWDILDINRRVRRFEGVKNV